ncbi:ArsR/SmtB family transcription factor [Anaerocolumna xylanovorans]|uniref:DNA-binding transcriptional regulator, ArsR family n=1 Tax=Anaerocolumna xylanovorans DSM 12503 TaxID=1121345 RepID=A0A1M7Y3X3_9FIRM|nr:metalloregulator ArsR/SmtB family transcription factor [Anaerocolumna xylanovorans]SHO46947.1 DNA-binding transcriptional regulator, ArsR family [Anaerocolumna xylanovorans DSM 12503]
MEIGAYKVYTEPNWEYELVTCILEKDGKREEDSVKARKFLMSQKEIEKFLENIKEYKENVLKKILPLLEDYPDIKPYFVNSSIEDDSRARHILVSLASRRELSKEHASDEIDSIMLDMFENWAKSINDTGQKEEKFKDLTDIITFLRGVEEDDSTKLRLIMLFTERHTVLPRIQEFVKKGVEVLKEYYHIIQEDFDSAVVTLKDKKNMEDCLDKLEVLKLGDVDGMTVQPCIVAYNQLSIDWFDEDNRDIMADTGIYMFLPEAMTNDFSGNDARIVSALKALGDATRLKIIHMLSGKKMYIQEIADDLSLTPATVSHHMNILLQERLISITVDTTRSKKIFYEINASKMKELGEVIKLLGTLAEGNQE